MRPPFEVARELLGAEIVTTSPEGSASGLITEVEAYGANDEASHSFRGPTARNKVMFAEGGHCYVYRIYGLHFCVNVVTESEGIGSAVLIRAIKPFSGVELMKERRKLSDPSKLASGPGKICQALGIDMSHNGENLISSTKIFLKPNSIFENSSITYSKRIGISKAKDLAWRIVGCGAPLNNM